MVRYFLYCSFIVVLISSFGCSNENIVTPVEKQTPLQLHCQMGIPQTVVAEEATMIVRPQYVLSVSKSLNVCRWVSWNLNKEWYGAVPRYSGKFLPDTALPQGFRRIVHDDYTNSGYDRGHMVRSEERTATNVDNQSTFYMTNVLPQTPTLNQQTWLSLEYECERLCKQNEMNLYVIAGGVFSKNPTMIKNVVAVPDSCWKVVVILPRGAGLGDVTSSTPVYAVMMANTTYTSNTNSWQLYRTTVRSIEQSTGLNLLSSVPTAIQDVIETTLYKPLQ